MPKKVRILKRFIDGGKVFGVGGEYTLSDLEAKKHSRAKKAEIIEDLGTDPEVLDTSVDYDFLSKIEQNAGDILDILDAEYQRREQIKKDHRPFAVNVDGYTQSNQQTEETMETGQETVAGDSSESGQEASESEDQNTQNQDTETGQEGASVPPGAPQDNNKGDNQSNKGTEIPEGFPGRKALLDSEDPKIEFIEDIPRDREKLIAVNGVGERLANQIEVALQQYD